MNNITVRGTMLWTMFRFRGATYCSKDYREYERERKEIKEYF
jgi:hypothetical protein